MWFSVGLVVFLISFGSLFSGIEESQVSFEIPLVNASTSSSQQTDNPKNFLAYFMGEPSTLVDGSVNVITGAFSEVQNDLIICNAEPLIIQRSYSSLDADKHSKVGTLQYSWNWNHGGNILFDEYYDIPKKVKPSFALYTEGGAVIQYEDDAIHPYLTLSKGIITNGLTNSGSGQISGRTNLKNNKLFWDEKKQNVHLTTGAGSIQYLKERKKEKSLELQKVRMPNGNFLTYEYKKDKLERINSKNSADSLLSFALICWDNFKVNPKMIVYSSDNRHVKYQFVKKKGGRYFLESVLRPDGSTDRYTYEPERTDHIERLIRIDGHDRFKEIAYYKSGKNQVGDTQVKGNIKSINRVMLLRAPVGTDMSPIITHRFFYEFTENKRTGHSKGKTTVYNALNNKTNYHYNEQHRLTGISKFDGDKYYSKEKLYWGKEKKPDESNLLSRTLQNAEGQIQFCCAYQYDQNGNVLKESLFGNLTGNNSILVSMTPEGTPSYNGCECFQKEYSYSSDGFNLLLKEVDGRKIHEYGYYANTDLLRYKFVRSMDGQLRQRQFFYYDANGSLIRDVLDDGSALEDNQLIGVTERHIKVIQPQTEQPIGLPKIMVEKVLDIATGQEVNLKTVIHTYDQEGKLTKQDYLDSHDQYCYSLYWEYNKLGKVTKETNALGQEIERSYDENKNMTSEKGPNPSYHKKYYYDYMDRLFREDLVNGDGTTQTVMHHYNFLSQKVATTDRYGNSTEYLYDGLGRLTETRYPFVANESGKLIQPKETFQYDLMGNPIVKTDANGNSTHTKYTVRGEPYFTQTPDGSVETATYTPDGLLAQSCAKNGVKTSFSYDYLGRLLTKAIYSPTGELLSSSSSTYNAFHQLTDVDPSGQETSYQYDFAGRLNTVLKGDKKIVYVYDLLGRVSKLREFYGYNAEDYTAKVMVYDLLSRMVEERVEDSSGIIQRKINYGYDQDGNRSQVIVESEAGIACTITMYNAYQEPICITDPKGNQTHYQTQDGYLNSYGQFVARKEVIDPLGNCLLTTCDALGRIVSTIRKNSIGQIIQKNECVYDAVGNRCKLVETVFSADAARQVITRWQYDAMNREISLTEALGEPEEKQTKVLFNSFGQKETIRKPDGVLIQHTYDALGRLKTFYGSDHSFSYLYQYDVNNNVVEVQDLINQTSTTKTYDAQNRLLTETLGNGITITYCYDRQGKPTRIEIPDGSSVVYRYEGILLKEIQRLDARNQPIYKHLYTEYDLAGNSLQSQLIGQAGNLTTQYDLLGRTIHINTARWQESIPSTGYDPVGNMRQRDVSDSIGNSTYRYDYDDLYQLKSEEGNETLRYENDSLYNRIAKNGQINQVNALNQLLDDSNNQFLYDKNGNLKSLAMKSQAPIESSMIFTYDSLDRLNSCTQENKRVQYRYDESNRRLSKQYFRWDDENQAWVQISTDHFLYQGQNEVGLCDVNGCVVEFRVLGIGKGAEVGAAVALELNGQVFAPVHDHQGNVICLLNAINGSVFESYRFSAFGEEQLFDQQGLRLVKSINPWRFSSKRYDEETGFLNFGRRYYQPQIGRWLTADPIGYAGGPNLYAYVLNQPMTHNDLYGLSPERDRRYDHRTNEYTSRAQATIRSIATLPGRTIEYLARNWVPIPYVKDGLEIVGRYLAGRSFKSFTSNCMKSSSCGYMGEWMHDRLGGVCGNGIGTRKGELLNRVQRISDDAFGARMYYVHRQRRGTICDLIGCMLERLGVSTENSRVMKESLHFAANAVGGTSGTGRLMVSVHSGAGGVLHNVKDSLGSMKDMMHVYTMGCPVAASSKDFAKAKNYISGYDCVPWLCNPIGCIEGKLGYNPDMYFFPATTTPWGDHFYDGTNYQKAVRTFTADFNKQSEVAFL